MKDYGIVYCVLRNSKNSPDGLCDIMVKAEDAPKITRVAERFKFATVDKAKIENEIVKAKAQKTAVEKATGAEPEAPDKNDTEKLRWTICWEPPEGKAEPEKPEAAKAEPDRAAAKEAPANPAPARTEKSPPSEPTSGSRSKSARGTSDKPSVREELRDIKATRAGLAAQSEKDTDAPKRDEKAASDKPKPNPSTTHKQPQNIRKPKSKNTKAR